MAATPNSCAREQEHLPRGGGMFRIKSPQDAGAAIVFMAIGLAGVYFGSDLTFGTSARMGPGYFPIILSWIIFAIGVIVGLKGLTVEGPPIEAIQLRPLLVIISAIIAFGYLVERLGLAITAAFLTVLAGYARRDVNLWETFLLAAGLAVFCVVIFVYALSQPFPAWWGR
jgi:putative tricarboxylic transport membrane protein